MQVDPSIFKAYDIRGIYPDPLTEEVAYAIGRALVALLKCEEVVVGRDMRLSSPAIKEHLLRGLVDQGADVIDIGMVSTDQYYYACATLDRPGAMVTASHNPPEYCGFKMVRQMPYLLSGESGIQDLRRLVAEESWGTSQRQGVVRAEDVTAGFIDKVLSLVDPARIKPLKVVADTGNGMVGPILQDVYERLPIEFIGMYLEPDGHLPNHGLDPMQPENRADLEEGAVFAGELSGHYYFRDFFGADSGIVPSLVMLELLSQRGVKLSELLAPLEHQYFTSSEINSEVADPAAKIAALADHYQDGHIQRLDGISVSYDDWHFNVRPSNTEPLLRLNLEALSAERMAESGTRYSPLFARKL